MGQDNDTLDISGINPYWQDDGRVVRWDTFCKMPQDRVGSNAMQVVRSFIDSEDESRRDRAPNSAQQVLVVNKDTVNQCGEHRAYRVQPASGGLHLTDVGDPPVDFARFFDGEPLDREDIVPWLNLGMHHVPHTGDLPGTVFTTAGAGAQFVPSNYFDLDQSRRIYNAVRMNYSNGTATEVETFGQKDQSCDVDFTPVERDLWGYRGDVVVRKFPYDPDGRYYQKVTKGIQV
ncbi:hypothetical protein LQW54_003445 [Pestalotiopsis sp. IQ-011]